MDSGGRDGKGRGEVMGKWRNGDKEIGKKMHWEEEGGGMGIRQKWGSDK